MGLCGSKDDEKKKTARKQGRRLSVDEGLLIGELPGGKTYSDLDDALDRSRDPAARVHCAEEQDRLRGYVRHFSRTRKGVSPMSPNKHNQDRTLALYGLYGQRCHAFVVMDGHGKTGHVISEYLSRRLVGSVDVDGNPVQLDEGGDENALFSEDKELDDEDFGDIEELKGRMIKGSFGMQPNLLDKPHEGISRLVLSLQSDLQESKIDTTFSGSTFCMALLHKYQLYVANVGDSRCVVCRMTDDDSISAVQLSFDHKPDVPEENTRILKAKGRVHPIEAPYGEDPGPHRVWLAKYDTPGLAMSRSLGDELAKTVGVIADPEILEHKLSGDDLFLVVASDGVFEFLKNEEVCALIYKYKDRMAEGCRRLVELAIEKWSDREEVIDDITVCVVDLQVTAERINMHGYEDSDDDGDGKEEDGDGDEDEKQGTTVEKKSA